MINYPKFILFSSLFLMLMLNIILSFISTFLTIFSEKKTTNNESKVDITQIKKNPNLYLYIALHEIYNYKPKNYGISKCKLHTLSIELQIHTQKGIYKAYIYPELCVKKINNIAITKEISEYLKTIDNFIYIIQKQEGNSFKEIYLFDTRKIYIY